MKNIFIEITERLDTLAALKWVDEDKGQMNFERPPILFPAALVTIDLPNTTNITNKIQDAKMVVSVLLCFDYSGNTNTKTPSVERVKSLAYYDTVEQVKQLLQGWGGLEFNPMARSSFRQIKRPDAYKTVLLTFGSAFVDEND